jgi:hypothetical protein
MNPERFDPRRNASGVTAVIGCSVCQWLARFTADTVEELADFLGRLSQAHATQHRDTVNELEDRADGIRTTQ